MGGQIQPPSKWGGVGGYYQFGDSPDFKTLMHNFYQALIDVQKQPNLVNLRSDSSSLQAVYDKLAPFLDQVKQNFPDKYDALNNKFLAFMNLSKNPHPPSNLTGEQLGEIDKAYEEFHNNWSQFSQDTNAQNILKNSGFFNNITNFADPQQFQAIEIDYSQPAGSSHADDFNNLNIQYQNAFNDLMNTVGNLQ